MLFFGEKDALNPAPRIIAYLLLFKVNAVRMESSQFMQILNGR